MKATYVDYSETNSFSSTALSYLSRDPKLQPFISHFPTIEGFGKLMEEKTVCADRKALVEVLKRQYRKAESDGPGAWGAESLKLKAESDGLGAEREVLGTESGEAKSLMLKAKSLKLKAESRLPVSGSQQLIADSLSPVEANIELLAGENTYTITTGHQLNIFTGPLYFIYKIVTAINLARELKQAYPDKNFVPVYWMASEDHDFAEINHVYLHGKSVVWEQDVQGATGRLPTDSMAPAVKEYLSGLGLSENSGKLSAIIEEAYLRHDNLADATRYLVNALFGDYGVVVIDADAKEFKQQFAGIIEEDIVQNHSFRTISESSARLSEAGFSTQVNAREINFFYMKDQLRERVVEKDGTYFVLNSDIRFTREELEGEIRQYPERFSPNVIMRPLYQEVILPNLAYIGGGSEVVYWLQLKANFDHYQVPFPILILRNSALITDEAFGSKLCRLHIRTRDIFKDTETLQKEWVLTHSQNTLNLSDEKSEFQALFEKIKLRAYKIDPTLAPSAEAVKARLQRALDNLEHKFIKAEKRHHEGALLQIANLRDKYFPGGGLQERKENFGLFYLKYGDELIAELVRHFKPLDFKFTILEP